MTRTKKQLTTSKPFLKWVGGKGKLAPQLKTYTPKKYNTFYEPFVGGGALFFYCMPAKAFINDINKTLMGAYKNVRDNPEQLIDCLSKMQKNYYSNGKETRKQVYYEARHKFNTINNPEKVEKSCLLIFLNKTCYNGMYRENSQGEFNVPFGDYKQPLICDERTILSDSKVLQQTNITSTSFEDAVSTAQEEDFVYFDPPYYPLTKTANFTDYSEFGFEENDQIKLKELFDDLTKRGSFVMLSNSNAPFIKELYRDYRQEKVLANRAINCKADGRGKIEELVILNY